jgi:uncharacterized protein with GYD domain
MPLYMTQFAYRRDAWEALKENPERVAGRVVSALEDEFGGRLVSLNFFFGLGRFHGVLTFEAADDTTATAILLASLSSPHIESSETAKLLTVDEFSDALRRAGGVTYQGPPGTAS